MANLTSNLYLALTDEGIEILGVEIMKFRTLAKLVILPITMILSSCFAVGSEVEKRDVSSFSSLEVSGLAEVFITQSDIESVEVRVSSMPIDDVITRVDNGKLIVTTKGFHQGEDVKVYVSYIQLESIKTDGSAELTGVNTLNTQGDLSITTGGAGDILSLDIIALNLDINIRGAGNADLDVNVNTVTINMRGAGDLDISGVAQVQKIGAMNSRGTLDNHGLSYSD